VKLCWSYASGDPEQPLRRAALSPACRCRAGPSAGLRLRCEVGGLASAAAPRPPAATGGGTKLRSQRGPPRGGPRCRDRARAVSGTRSRGRGDRKPRPRRARAMPARRPQRRPQLIRRGAARRGHEGHRPWGPHMKAIAASWRLLAVAWRAAAACGSSSGAPSTTWPVVRYSSIWGGGEAGARLRLGATGWFAWLAGLMAWLRLSLGPMLALGMVSAASEGRAVAWPRSRVGQARAHSPTRALGN
jgi:hypothetical protein